VAYNVRTNRERSTFGGVYRLGTFDYVHFEADLLFKVAGFSLQAEVLYRSARGTRQRSAVVDGETVTERGRSGLGAMVQCGCLLGFVPVELAARYAEVWPVGSVTATARQRELVGGFSYYDRAHDLKLQFDFGRLLDEVTGLSEARRWRGRWQARLQAQLWF
jgi:hypothetical protein